MTESRVGRLPALRRAALLAICAGLLFGPAVGAQESDVPTAEAVEKRLRSLYPATQFSSVRAAEIDGLFEVVMGRTVAYTDATGRYLLVGNMVDMRTMTDLTAQKRTGVQEPRRVAFPAASLNQALKTVRGTGDRVLAVFSDPDCPYCQSLEKELLKLTNVTVYTFLLPLEQLHPGASKKAESVWCSKDKAGAWAALMTGGRQPKATACSNPLRAVAELAGTLGVSATPTLISLDGRIKPGAAPAAEIERWLSAGESGTTKETAP